MLLSKFDQKKYHLDDKWLIKKFVFDLYIRKTLRTKVAAHIILRPGH